MMKKKILSVLLILCMMLASIPVFVQAEKSSAGIPDFLASLGVSLPEEEVDVTDLQRSITKKELLYLIVQAMDKNAHVEKQFLTFPDVKLDTWYHDNNIFAANTELVFGHEDGRLGIDDEVSEQTAGIIMLRVLGFASLAKQMGNADPVSLYSGIYQGLLKNVNRDGVLTLEETYQMIYNMLMSEYVAMDMEGSSVAFKIAEDRIYMESAFQITKQEGRITGNYYTQLGIGGVGTALNTIEIDGVVYDTIMPDTQAYLGYYVDYYVDDSGSSPVVVYAIPDEKNLETRISSADIWEIERVGNFVVIRYDAGNENEKRVRIPLSCDFVYNGKTADFSMELLTKLDEAQFGEIVCVEYKDDYLVTVTAYDTVIVDAVSLYDEKIFDKNGADPVSIKEPEGHEFLKFVKDGVGITASEIQKGDVLQVAQSLDGGSKLIEVCNYTLVGELTGNLSNEYIHIDNVEYKVSNYYLLRAPSVQLGITQTFLFNTLGEVVDVVEDSEVYEGEYVYLLDIKDCSEEQENLAIIKYVTMDANIMSVNLAEKVRLNGGKKAFAPAVVTRMTESAVTRQMIYIETNQQGLVDTIYTSDGIDVDGFSREQDYISHDATQKRRKCKGSRLFLVDTNDANFPEFYITSATKILMVPAADASDDIFKDAKSYAKKTTAAFRDAQDYTVEAYNFNDFNVADILLLCESKSFESRYSAIQSILVTNVGESLNSDDVAVPTITGYQAGEKVEIKLFDESVLYYTEDAANVKIKKGDIIRLNLNDAGEATHSEYIMNIDTMTVTNTPIGRNDGQAYMVGYVVDNDGSYMRIRFSDSATVKERVVQGQLNNVTIYNLKTGKCEKGTAADLTPGRMVFTHIHYSSVQDLIVLTAE
ncbi:MAG: hypothetical protein E7397_07780 [Ruminococcaceae bacterium]|nr:hypothetical protein [Oscillospiraceae bacterium]